MALELPDWLTDAFNLIGLPWPGIDEDQLRAWATSVRQFANDIVDNSSQTNQTMQGLADSSQSSVIGGVAQQYESHHRLLTELHGPMDDFAQALDYAADAVVAQKWIVIGAATALAAEFTATQIGAIFTLGADEAALPAEVISTQQIVKFALKDLEAVVIGKLINWGATELSDHVNHSIVTLANDAWGLKMEAGGLKIAYQKVSDAAKQMRGQADEAERTGNRAHAENTSRNLEDHSGAGGWAEVINALKQGLLDIAGDLFKSLPATIARVLRDIAGLLERFAARLRGADEEGGAAAAGGAAAGAPGAAGLARGSKPPGAEPALAGARDTPNAHDSPHECQGAGDPVDVVTGGVMLTETDVTLPGVLPLVLERAHRSSMQPGRWFGPAWMSSLDQRLLVTDGQVLGAFADGRVLTWPAPPDSADDPPVIPVSGPVWPLRRDPDGSYSVSDPQRGLTWRFEHGAGYEDELPLVSVTDRIGHEIAFSYDAAGRPLSVVHSGGYRVLVTVTDEHVTALTLAGRDDEDDVPLRTFEYDTDSNLSGVINSSGLPMRFTYDDARRLTSWTDRNDYSYRYTYDDQGRCIRGDGPDGMLSGTFTYEPGTTRWTTTDGAVTTYEITGSSEVAAITDALGNTTRWEHDEHNRVTAEIDPLGRVTRYSYDNRGNMIGIVRADGTQATAHYDEHSQLVSLTGPDESQWRHEYDEHGNQILLETPGGIATRFGYDEHGHVATVTAPDGSITVVTCNAVGLPTQVTGPDDTQIFYEINAFGQVTRLTDPSGARTSFSWTSEGRPASRTFPDGATESWEWDGEENLIRHLSAAGGLTAYDYGPFDQVSTVTWPDGNRTEFSYNHALRTTQVTQGRLNWRYGYDSSNQLVTETDYNGATTAYQYDASGQLIQQVNAAGQEIGFGYDSLGNLIEQVADGEVTAFGYDSGDRLVWARNPDAEVRFEYDPAGRITVQDCNGRAITTSYDIAGFVTRRTTPSGVVTNGEPDNSGQPAAITTNGHRQRFGYSRNAQQIRRSLPGGASLTQEWDQCGRLTAQSLGGPDGRQLQHRAYHYRADGFPNRIDDLLTGSRAFTLDTLGQVTAASGPDWTEQYAYNQLGTVTSASFPPLPANTESVTQMITESQGGRQVRGTEVTQAGNIRYRHDAVGRVVTRVRTRISRKPETWRYEWDAANRLTTAVTPDGTTWHYCYDPFGRRIAKRHIGTDGEILGEIRFSWDGPALAEQAEIAGDREYVTTWDYEDGTLVPLAQYASVSMLDAPQDVIDQRFYAIITDLAGAPAELVSSDGTLAGVRRHTLWGNTVWDPEGIETPLRFIGQYDDAETGLHYNNQRYYDPLTGSYLSPDPLGLSPGPNPHAYVPNPCIESDPLGLQAACAGYRTEALAARQRAKDLEKKLGFGGGTVGVLGIRNTVDNTISERVTITGKKSIPGKLGNDISPQEWISCPKGSHAEQNIFNNLGPDEEIIYGGASTNICRNICAKLIRGNGMAIGGPYRKSTTPKINTGYRSFWKRQRDLP